MSRAQASTPRRSTTLAPGRGGDGIASTGLLPTSRTGPRAVTDAPKLTRIAPGYVTVTSLDVTREAVRCSRTWLADDGTEHATLDAFKRAVRAEALASLGTLESAPSPAPGPDAENASGLRSWAALGRGETEHHPAGIAGNDWSPRHDVRRALEASKAAQPARRKRRTHAAQLTLW